MKRAHQFVAAAALATSLIAAAAQVHTAASQETKTVPANKSATEKPPTASQLATRERLKKCGAEWKAAKTAGTIEKGMKWSKFWSVCNKRLRNAKGT